MMEPNGRHPVQRNHQDVRKQCSAVGMTSEFDYVLPGDRIAQAPASPREQAKLMVVNKKERTTAHRRVADLVEYLGEGDLIVWNNSKVFKARLLGYLVAGDGRTLLEHKKPVEIFLVRPMENPGVWQVLAKPGKHIMHGARVQFFDPQTKRVREDFYCDVILKEKDGTMLVQFPYNDATVRAHANRYGAVPLPPYIKDEKHELETYQTVYAEHEGSVAAPTAGFHFTEALIEKIKKRGVQFAEVTLHVGLGTFLPVKTEVINDHVMHSEWISLTSENAEKINRAKREGRRVIAVGTTTVRTLEGICRLQQSAKLHAYEGDINIFIIHGFQFRVVDAMLTNFHLPKSTLLMLVAAFVGDTQFVLHCYQEAIDQNYRFYSFGDAMFIQ